MVKDGAVLVRHAWGYVNGERRNLFTPQTLIQVSIIKQFTCGLMLDAFPDPSLLDRDVDARLQHVAGPPGALHLCQNQPGLRGHGRDRDYRFGA